MANLGKTVIVAALDGTFQRKVSACVFVSTCQSNAGKQFVLTHRCCVAAEGADGCVSVGIDTTKCPKQGTHLRVDCE